ncbi:hypothetical protein CLH62_01750 [Marinobacter guineae]|uniref:DegT/DnrJ/EryC1/StrS aminotransferase n=1 Tax=Marinobacter guineae TaxID=432303 RepID=A0A2G1VHY4_9GAMM|nr:DegT/DnrJ/EryC1/StrS family aminotransferase [Marinobacter guineae]PHQ26348.1 hypothetical protein CLH62_01750 [Marinobacter guineae]
MSLSKLRPVGSRIPRPSGTDHRGGLEWGPYEIEYFDSGTSALAVAVKCSLALRPSVQSPEVLLPAYGCPDLVSAIISQDLTPRLVDLEAGTPWMDLECLRASVSENTVAIIAVNFLGISERLDELGKLASEFGLVLIEDSAQQFPPTSARAGIADFAVLSFGRGKPINLMGGGALLVRQDHYQASNSIINGFPYKDQRPGIVWFLKRAVFNTLMNRRIYGVLEKIPFLGLGQTTFEMLEGITRIELNEGLLSTGAKNMYERQPLEAGYRERLEPLTKRGWTLLPENCKRAPGQDAGVEKLLRYSLLAPSFGKREDTIKALNAIGIGANSLYNVPLSRLAGASEHLANASSEFQSADAFADRLLTLPCHEDVLFSDLDCIERVLLDVASNE